MADLDVNQEFALQWSVPSDVFSVLLLLGPEVIGKALAQLTGSWFTPVAFSFGKSYFQHTAARLSGANNGLQAGSHLL